MQRITSDGRREDEMYEGRTEDDRTNGGANVHSLI